MEAHRASFVAVLEAGAVAVDASPTAFNVRDDSPIGKNRDGVTFGPKRGSVGLANERLSANGVGSGGFLYSERTKALVAALHHLPELTLEETTRVRAVFTGLMGERESIANILELQVLLGDLGLYPSEEELHLVLDAYRGKIGLSSLCHYLRFYKHEYITTSKIDAAKQQRLSSAANGAGAPSSPPPRSTWMGTRGGDAYPPSATRAGAADRTAYTFGSPNKKAVGDADTLKAFVALGGHEDGSGEIRANALSALVREFGLTVDIDSMIAVVDVHRSGVLDYEDFCTMWTLPEESLRRSSVGSFSVLDAARSPRRKESTSADALAWHNGGDISPSTQRARERMIAALARSGRQSITLTQGLPWKANGGALSPRATVFGTNAMAPSQSPVAASVTTTTTSTAAINNNAMGVATTRVRPMYSCVNTNPVLQGPITHEEHMLLLTVYLFPERYEGVFPHPGESNGCRNNGNRHASISGLPGGSGHHRSLGGRRGTSRAALSASQKNRNVSPDDDDVLGGKGNGYRPPSPMILSMRTSAAYQERKTAKLREPIRCPYHGSGLAATVSQRSVGGACAATTNPTANPAEDGYNSNADARNATW